MSTEVEGLPFEQPENFEFTPENLDRAKAHIDAEFRPDGYNIGVNVGRAGGQSRMHVHVHLIPRYTGDVADPRGGIRCVLAGRAEPAH